MIRWLFSMFLMIIQGVCILTAFAQTGKSNDQRVLFTEPLRTIGRGISSIAEGNMLLTKNQYALFGDSAARNYTFSFSAKNPDSCSNVQIWAGFRHFNRDDRYVIGLRGGNQKNLYLSRMGYMGTDEMLGLADLNFTPLPGQWYRFKIVVVDEHIAVYLNDEQEPVLHVIDKNARLAPSGELFLGGGWLPTVYKDLSIKAASLKDIHKKKMHAASGSRTGLEKERMRVQQREAYRPVNVEKLQPGRTELSLNGNWLFMPAYQLHNETAVISPRSGDDKWHVMPVPSFWNPIRIWLHGETFAKFSKGVSDAYYRQETARCGNYTFDYDKTQEAWYRQWINLPDGIEKKKTELTFDAISKIGEVWINGIPAGKHIGMFGELRIDASRLLKAGKNLIAVKVTKNYVDVQDADKVVDVAVSVPVTNKMLKDLPHGFYGDDPAGIWQNVSLTISDPVSISDAFIQPTLSAATISLAIHNASSFSQSLKIVTQIVEKSTGQVLKADTSKAEENVMPGSLKKIKYTITDLKPKLWTPQQPNLYEFQFLIIKDAAAIDQFNITSGFRTFESRDGFLWLNGQKFWLRGANHTPFALNPDSRELADTFFSLMKTGNIEITRTHTTPWNELWMDAADSSGIGISYEGTWPWLMINASMPDENLIKLWADEFLALVKKYKNHPSLLFWTINNEMKFYDNDPDPERAKLKMAIVSEVVKRIREEDPTRPIVFDSNYKRNIKKFGSGFFDTIDDGDIDDIHAYINWYDHSVFTQFKGEFQNKNKNEGRPLISQEMSTGYPNNETGHATRFYNLVHQTPQSLIGNLSYEFADPAYFLASQTFITKELAEALRRSNPASSGILHFALLTWFKNVYDAKSIQPLPTYFGLQKALNPVLVSAELWGRNVYAGDTLFTKIYIVNDAHNGLQLDAGGVKWSLYDKKNHKIITSGELKTDPVAYYGRSWKDLSIPVPDKFDGDRCEASLKLEYFIGGKKISDNDYDIFLGKKSWLKRKEAIGKMVISDNIGLSKTLDEFGISYQSAQSVEKALQENASLYIFTGLGSNNCSAADMAKIRSLVKSGKKVLIIRSDEVAQRIFPEYITGILKDNEADIATPEVLESPVFNDIDPMLIRYFYNKKSELPQVCETSFSINRSPGVTALLAHTKIHGYISGEMNERAANVKEIRGFPIIGIKDNGEAILSTLLFNKAATDPVAGKLLVNIISYLAK